MCFPSSFSSFPLFPAPESQPGGFSNYNLFPGLWTGFLARLGCWSSLLCTPSSTALRLLFTFRLPSPHFFPPGSRRLAVILPQSFGVVGKERLTAGPGLFLLSYLWRRASIMPMLAKSRSKLYTNAVYNVISKASRSSKPIPVSGALRSEISHWLFLDTWNGFLPWKEEKHSSISDESNVGWGG